MSELSTDCLNLVKVPHAALFTVAMPVANHPLNIAEAARVAERMVQIMRNHKGIGLAANQVGLPIRVFVCFIEGVTEVPMVCINPEIELAGDMRGAREGCLSDPGAQVFVRRRHRATLTYTDTGGDRLTVKGYGLLARVWQHEIDHLNGINIRAKKGTDHE